MNPAEAHDAQLLLAWLLEPHTITPADEDLARAAAQRLGHASHAVLGAGLDGGYVADRWEDLLSTCAGCASCADPGPPGRTGQPDEPYEPDPTDQLGRPGCVAETSPPDRRWPAVAGEGLAPAAVWRVGGLHLAVPGHVSVPDHQATAAGGRLVGPPPS